MNRINLLLIICGVLFFPKLTAQVNSQDYQLSVKKTTEEIIIDGKLDEKVWSEADKANNFIQNFPTDSLKATSQTEVSVTFDDQFLYVAGISYENSDKKHIMQSLKRDFDWPLNDNFSIYFDPYNDFTNGFTFGITPAGVQREGILTNGRNISRDWDNKWFSAVHDAGAYWSFEFAIPFKSIRYNVDSRQWNIIFLRLDLKNNERSSWAPVPQGYRPSSMSFAGRLNFEDELPKAGVNVSFIPFITGGVSKNHEENESVKSNLDAGFDAKVALSSALNLDLTFNPDFSQVEVDQQVTNLNRFEIAFPEKRQFFLENNDLFGENGFRSSRPFFSRRIGIVSSPVIIDGKDETLSGQVPIQYGVRLSGKIGNNWRIGLLNMLTKEATELAIPEQMYSIAVVQHKLFTRSSIGFMVVNKNSFGLSLSDTTKFHFNESLFKEKGINDETALYANNFNTVYGTDFNFRSSDNKWESNIYYHRSVSPQGENGEFATGAFLGYTVRKLRLRGFVSSISDDYNAEVGFIRRKGIRQIGSFADYFFYPTSSIINNHGPTVGGFYVTDVSNNRTDYNVRLGYQIELLNTSRIEFNVENRFQKLRSDFDPTGTDDDLKLQEGDDFSWNRIAVEFNTDTREIFSFEGQSSIGGFYNGDRFNVAGQLNYRYQPYGSIALRFDYNKIDLPQPFNSAEFWLIGPRIDFTFTDKIFLTTFVQYNEQDDNLNINMRLQYRYKPASDLFIVYTDNYFPESLGIKNRALVMKLNYWLNI